jgi:hypothetical protein
LENMSDVCPPAQEPETQGIQRQISTRAGVRCRQCGELLSLDEVADHECGDDDDRMEPDALGGLPERTELEGNCARKGWAWKRTKHVKKWKRRYFVLWPQEPSPTKGRLLFYFTTDTDQRPRGVIALVPRKFSAQLTTPPPIPQGGPALRGALKIQLKELLIEDDDSIEEEDRESYLLADEDAQEIAAWGELLGATQGAADDAGGEPSPAATAGTTEGDMRAQPGPALTTVDPAPLFQAAQTGDVRAVRPPNLCF